MSHPSGLSLVTSHIVRDGVSPLLWTYGLTASDCGPGSYYGQGIGEGQRRSQSDEWTLQTSTGYWVHRLLVVGVVPVPSVLETWRRLAIVVPSVGGTLGGFVSLRGIKYGTG